MQKIMVELVERYFQYATQIDSRLPLSKNNIGYSIYPHRAIDGSHIDQVREILPDFNFKIVDDNGYDIKEGAQKEFFDKPSKAKGYFPGKGM